MEIEMKKWVEQAIVNRLKRFSTIDKYQDAANLMPDEEISYLRENYPMLYLAVRSKQDSIRGRE